MVKCIDMNVILNILDEHLMEYVERRITLHSIIMYDAVDWSDVDAGTYIFTGYNRLKIKEPIDKLELLMWNSYKDMFDKWMKDIIVVNTKKTRKK